TSTRSASEREGGRPAAAALAHRLTARLPRVLHRRRRGTFVSGRRDPMCLMLKQSGYSETSAGGSGSRCLNINMFCSLAQARVVISDWKADYNHRRQHSALGYQAP